MTAPITYMWAIMITPAIFDRGMVFPIYVLTKLKGLIMPIRNMHLVNAYKGQTLWMVGTDQLSGRHFLYKVVVSSVDDWRAISKSKHAWSGGALYYWVAHHPDGPERIKFPKHRSGANIFNMINRKNYKNTIIWGHALDIDGELFKSKREGLRNLALSIRYQNEERYAQHR